MRARTIDDFENERRKPLNATLVTLRLTFEQAGVCFTEGGGVEPKAEA